MDSRAMSSRGGGSFRNIFVVVLLASVFVLGYRYSTLRRKFEDQNMVLVERDYEVRDKQEEASGFQRQLADSDTAKQQCEATLEKERKDNRETRDGLEGKVKELEATKNNLQTQLNECKDKNTEIDNLKKEKEGIQNEANQLRQEKDELQRLLDETKRQLQEARNPQPNPAQEKQEQAAQPAQPAQPADKQEENPAAKQPDAQNLEEIDAHKLLIQNSNLQQGGTQLQQVVGKGEDGINDGGKLLVVPDETETEQKTDEETEGETDKAKKESEDEEGTHEHGNDKTESNDDVTAESTEDDENSHEKDMSKTGVKNDSGVKREKDSDKEEA